MGRAKTLSEVCQDAGSFLMIYGSDGDRTRRTRSTDLRNKLRAETSSTRGSVDVLRQVREFLRDYYGEVVGTDLTGEDGLDMDEASAVSLPRNIDAVLAREAS